MRRHHILLCVVALIAVLPLFVYGCSCGHDFDFHIQSWLEAKHQLLHGTFRPHWVFSAAYNAGEPRFVFYPPLSWMLGELLALVTPIAQLPAIYTLVVFVIAGQTMYLLAREFVSENASAIGASLYIVNPYMLFTAFERSAFAELLAAAWMPLLLRAVLKQPSIAGIAIPLALLWLTNAPAAVIGSYTMAVIMAVRLIMAWRGGDRITTRRHVLVAAASTGLGLALTGFYLIPAAYERRFVQIAMAVIVNMRVQDNFLFRHTGDADHDMVLRTASRIAVFLLGITAALLVGRFLAIKKSEDDPAGEAFAPNIMPLLAGLVIGIAFLLTPVSLLVWRYVPELAFLQFPWRLLTVIVVIFGLSAALLASSLRPAFASSACVALLLAAVATAFGSQKFRQGCEAGDYPAAIAKALDNHQGFPATDEYTPVGADNDALQSGHPAYWYEGDWWNVDPAKPLTKPLPLPGVTPQYMVYPLGSLFKELGSPVWSQHVSIIPEHQDVAPFTEQPIAVSGYSTGMIHEIVLNLRAYPNWEVSVNSRFRSELHIQPKPIVRADGLIAAGLANPEEFTLSVHWRRSLDEWIGIAISSVAALILAALLWRSRRINT